MKNKAFFKNWLLHSAALWMMLNIADVFTFFTNGSDTGAPMIALRHRFINHNYHQAIWIVALVFCLVVEINYQFVFQKYRFVIVKFISITLPLSLLVTGLLVLYTYSFGNFIVPAAFLPVPVIYLLYTATYIFIRNYFEANKARAEQLQQKTAAELKALKAQLNPHFFFNTLNTIYGTALEENAPRTAETIDKLSTLVRYVTEKAAQYLTPMANEIKCIEDYFQLQQMRIPITDNITITGEVQCEAPSLLIAPLLFLPFVENAFKYGISIDRPCFIKCVLSVKERALDLLIENSIIPGAAAKAGNGTGIANATKRLQLLYPQTHTLAITNDEKTFKVNLHIDL